MKSLLIAIFILIISSVNVAAQYIEGQENNHQDGIMTITTLSLPEEEPRMCTKEYAPVCAEVQVQCIKAPCYPAKQTFGNTCVAGNNPIIFQGECSSYLNEDLYNKLETKREALQELISKVSYPTLVKMNELLDQKIKMTKISRIAVEMQKQRITKYAFIKSVVSAQLSAK
jgi:hypothetical protein